MDDQYRSLDFGAILPVAIVLLIILFPTVAAIVAPRGRQGTFFVLTLLFLPGPFGVAAAAIAQPREGKPPPFTREFWCGRCEARNFVKNEVDTYVCWRCDQAHRVPIKKTLGGFLDGITHKYFMGGNATTPHNIAPTPSPRPDSRTDWDERIAQAETTAAEKQARAKQLRARAEELRRRGEEH
ncbi:hypothetical protein [Mycobacterium neumannii]|uniref:hypothetical protein n=1 Tax=Mycobacterium neumannii TaxID=2048551 RepID=UPI003AB11507